MEYLDLSTNAVPAPKIAETSAPKEYGRFVTMAIAISWLVWILAIRFGAGLGKSEEILAFGTCGPAVAAILLSRRGKSVATIDRILHLLRFCLLWTSCWMVYVLGSKTSFSPRFAIIAALLALIPAWITSAAFSADTGVRQLLRSLVHSQDWRWPTIALFSFPTLLLIPTAILHVLGSPVNSPQVTGKLMSFVVYAALTFLRNFFFTAVLEEPGWRGFLLPLAQRKCSPLFASLLVWFPWALWHAPLDFTGGVGHSWISYVQIRVVFFIPITIILTWLYNRSGGNLLTAALFHAGMNTFPYVLPYAPPVLGLIFVWAGYAVIADKMWRRKEADKAPPRLELSEKTVF